MEEKPEERIEGLLGGLLGAFVGILPFQLFRLDKLLQGLAHTGSGLQGGNTGEYKHKRPRQMQYRFSAWVAENRVLELNGIP